MNHNRWNRQLLCAFWSVLGISVLIECSFLFVTDLPAGEFIWRYVVRPAMLMAIVILLAEVGIRRLPKFHNYMIISCSTLLTIIVTVVHSSLDYLLFLLFFPVMISIFYFSYSKIWYAIANTGIALFTLYSFDSEFHGRVSVVGLIAISSILAIYSVVAFGILRRGKELLEHLRTTFDSNQELLVRTILMDKLTKTDALTETYNHMAYHEYAERLVEQAESSTMKLHLALLDIDNFKSVNDTYGHRAGDAVLRSVADAARSKIDGNDVIARYGGEEFAILFAEKSFADVYGVVEEIREAIAAAPQEGLNGQTVTVSIGLNSFVKGTGKEALFHGADDALYDAKRSGKNRTSLSKALNWKTSSPA
jgi:diguanylate cyclase (GGDEF)-like protein